MAFRWNLISIQRKLTIELGVKKTTENLLVLRGARARKGLGKGFNGERNYELSEPSEHLGLYKKINGFGHRIQGVLNSASLPRTKFQRSGKDSANLGRVLEGTWAVQKGSWGSLGRHLGAS